MCPWVWSSARLLLDGRESLPAARLTGADPTYDQTKTPHQLCVWRDLELHLPEKSYSQSHGMLQSAQVSEVADCERVHE